MGHGDGSQYQPGADYSSLTWFHALGEIAATLSPFGRCSSVVSPEGARGQAARDNTVAF